MVRGGDLTGDIINQRVRTLLLLIMFFGLWIVIAIFALIIAILFNMYPQAVLPVWLEVPIAVEVFNEQYMGERQLHRRLRAERVSRCRAEGPVLTLAYPYHGRGKTQYKTH